MHAINKALLYIIVNNVKLKHFKAKIWQFTKHMSDHGRSAMIKVIIHPHDNALVDILHAAICYNRLDIVKYLVTDYDINLNKSVDQLSSAQLSTNNKEMLQYLLTEGAAQEDIKELKDIEDNEVYKQLFYRLLFEKSKEEKRQYFLNNTAKFLIGIPTLVIFAVGMYLIVTYLASSILLIPCLGFNTFMVFADIVLFDNAAQYYINYKINHMDYDNFLCKINTKQELLSDFQECIAPDGIH